MTPAAITLAAQIEEAELHALGLAEQAVQQRQNKRTPKETAERTESRVPVAEAIAETLRGLVACEGRAA